MIIIFTTFLSPSLKNSIAFKSPRERLLVPTAFEKWDYLRMVLPKLKSVILSSGAFHFPT